METFSWWWCGLREPTSNIVLVTLANRMFPKLVSYKTNEQYKCCTDYDPPKMSKSYSPLCQSYCHLIEKSIFLYNFKICVAIINNANIPMKLKHEFPSYWQIDRTKEAYLLHFIDTIRKIIDLIFALAYMQSAKVEQQLYLMTSKIFRWQLNNIMICVCISELRRRCNQPRLNCYINRVSNVIEQK